MQALTTVIAAFGLSGAAGLNAYIPLLIVAILGKLGWLTLGQPFDILTTWPVIIALGVLLAIEIVVDKIPAADSINDAIQTFVRPAAGAVLFAANTGVVSGIDPTVALIIGLVMALGVHGAKTVTRPVMNATTMGVAAPVMSITEDIIAAVGSLLAIFLPFVFIGFVLVMTLVIWWLIKRVRRIRERLSTGSA
jgi:hypothetical protein